MPFTIASIVEGHGEVASLPVLIRRLLAEGGNYADVPQPVRIKRDQFLNPQNSSLSNALELAAGKITRGPGAVLILIDSEGNCPARLGPELSARALALRSDLAIHVVLAHPMFEAWFLACAKSLAGLKGLPADLQDHNSAEDVRNPKAWVDDKMSKTRKYSETVDQPAFTAVFDLKSARRAPSFDKLCRELAAITQTTKG